MPREKFAIVSSETAGMIQELVLRIKLILRLIADRRVNFLLKLLPIASVVYLFSPIDLAPGLTLPIIGALDDAAVLWMGASLFVALCPDDIVQEHLERLQKVIPGSWREAKKESEIIEIQPKEEETN